MIEQWPSVFNEQFWWQICHRPLDIYKGIAMTRMSRRAAHYVPNLAFLTRVKSCYTIRMHLIQVGRMPSIDEEVSAEEPEMSMRCPVEPGECVRREGNSSVEVTTQTEDEIPVTIAPQQDVKCAKRITSKKLKMD